MAIQTVCDIFYRSVDTYRKPEHLKYKKDGAWRAISSEELRAAVEQISMGLRCARDRPGRQGRHPLREPARVGLRRPRRPLHGSGGRHDLRDPHPRPGPVHPGRLRVEGRLRLERGPGGEGRGGPRAAPAPPARGPLRRRARRGDDVARRAAGEGQGGARRRPRRGAPPRRRGDGGRPRHPHLHLGHHRRPQGGHAHPRQPAPQRPRRGEGLPDGGPRVDGAQLPAALPQLRAHRRPQLHAPPRGHDRLRGERREGAREHAGGAAARSCARCPASTRRCTRG